ncbi:MAG: response regulator [Candidatus Magnetominusculus sp. LBB02]|nr:response regulator [Candidatus Magnetominusculus sp. LBB02]
MKKRVLVIDDEQAIRDFLSVVLSESGYDVVTAEDGEAGLNEARRTTPDLITLDVMMPKKTGITVLGELRMDQTLSNVPVIMLTSVKNFIEQAIKDPDNAEILKQMETLLDDPDSKIQKFFLRFRSFRNMLLIDRKLMADQFRSGELTLGGMPSLPDVFLDKPVEPVELIHSVEVLLGK